MPASITATTAVLDAILRDLWYNSRPARAQRQRFRHNSFKDVLIPFSREKSRSWVVVDVLSKPVVQVLSTARIEVINACYTQGQERPNLKMFESRLCKANLVLSPTLSSAGCRRLVILSWHLACAMSQATAFANFGLNLSSCWTRVLPRPPISNSGAAVHNWAGFKMPFATSTKYSPRVRGSANCNKSIAFAGSPTSSCLSKISISACGFFSSRRTANMFAADCK
jgi:hypothetical protein